MSGLACDWWGGRWREDFDRAAETHQSAHRLSVEWSRIQPEPDKWDEEALEKYRAMLRGPARTRPDRHGHAASLHRPALAHRERGGWETEAVVPIFERFVRKTVEALKEYCTLWCTINEPNVYALVGYCRRRIPAGQERHQAGGAGAANMVRGARGGVSRHPQIQQEARVRICAALPPDAAASRWSPLDALMRNIRYTGINMAFPSAISTGVLRSPVGRIPVPEAKGTQDYFGLNYYSARPCPLTSAIRASSLRKAASPKDADLSDNKTNCQSCRRASTTRIKWAVNSYPDTPIIVTENGVEFADDRYDAATWRSTSTRCGTP